MNIPRLPPKDFIAAPTAVSNWIKFKPVSDVFSLTIISKFISVDFRILSIAETWIKNYQIKQKMKQAIWWYNNEWMNE